MSVGEHRKNAPSRPLRFGVLVVSTSRSLDDDRSGRRIVELVEEGGHTVVGRALVGDDVDAIRGAVSGLDEVDVVVLTGGTGLAPLDVTPEAVEPLFTRKIDGFGELFRLLSHRQVGSAAMLSRATAGVLADGRVVFALPGSVKACELAVSELVLPEVGHIVGLVGRASVAGEDVIETEFEAVEDRPPTSDLEPVGAERPPSKAGGHLGQLGGGSTSVSLEQSGEAGRPAAAEGEGEPAAAARGWKAAVEALGGSVVSGREELPQPIEKLAPVTNVLDTAGEVAVLRLPSGVRYGLYGWPDLQRPSSKVLAVGWGEPLAEVVALHRHPVATGTCIDEARGLLPQRTVAVGEVCERVTGRAPADTTGELFAVSGDTVWIQRGNRVFRWDGRAERDDGNPKQVLATLTLDWHAR